MEKDNFSQTSMDTPVGLYGITTLENHHANLVSAIVLFSWDNILGPKTVHMWTGTRRRQRYRSGENYNSTTREDFSQCTQHKTLSMLSGSTSPAVQKPSPRYSVSNDSLRITSLSEPFSSDLVLSDSAQKSCHSLPTSETLAPKIEQEKVGSRSLDIQRLNFWENSQNSTTTLVPSSPNVKHKEHNRICMLRASGSLDSEGKLQNEKLRVSGTDLSSDVKQSNTLDYGTCEAKKKCDMKYKKFFTGGSEISYEPKADIKCTSFDNLRFGGSGRTRPKTEGTLEQDGSFNSNESSNTANSETSLLSNPSQESSHYYDTYEETCYEKSPIGNKIVKATEQFLPCIGYDNHFGASNVQSPVHSDYTSISQDSASIFSSDMTSIREEGPDHHNVTQDVLNYAATLILNGEICKEWTTGHVDFKFYNIPDRELLLAAFVFAAESKLGFTVHSLAMFMPVTELSYYLSIQRPITAWMTRLAGKLRVLLEKTPTSIAADAFTTYLEDFVTMLSSLQEAGLPSEIYLCDTIFASLPNTTFAKDKKYCTFLRKAITSHIMTCGRSVVIGRQADEVNALIATLAMFNTQNERVCSRYVVKDRPWPYHHDLCIQGLLKDRTGEANIPIEEVYCSEYPTSIIDVSNHGVRQSLPCHEHKFRRYEILKQEIINLYTGNSNGYTFHISEKLFQPADFPETLINNLLKEILLLPPEDETVQSYINLFMLLLKRKAMTFISYIHNETNCGKLPLKTHKKTIRDYLSCPLDGDFRLILSVAETFESGLYAYLYGDPKEKSDKMRKIIDNF